ncbi:hypothetical protein KHQ81_06375 [Mycoplasmatota bacterium]|nr:hypothetical protein KHQ81_06375 [Mycoplasmatota bacterium]
MKSDLNFLMLEFLSRNAEKSDETAISYKYDLNAVINANKKIEINYNSTKVFESEIDYLNQKIKILEEILIKYGILKE